MNPMKRMTLAVAAAVLLVAAPAVANSQTAQVEKAAASGNLKRLERLLGDGFDPSALRQGRSPLHWAAWNGQVDAARLLIAHGVEADVNTPGGVTPLMHAVERRKHGMVRFLIGAGADVNAADNNGHTPLHRAAKDDAQESARILVKAGADVNVETDNRQTPLYLAAKYDAQEAARVLVEAGADVNAASANGNTPLHLAAVESGPEMVAFLLANGADPARVTKRDFTPLHVWALNGNPDTLTLLLDAGSDPLLRVNTPELASHQFLPLDGVRKHNPQVLDTEPGRRLQRLTYEGTGCEGVIVVAGDTKLSILAERTLGRASRWKEIVELNGLEGKGYKKGDCLALP